MRLENNLNFIKKVKFKVLLTSLIAGASLFTANYSKPVYAASCEDPNVQAVGSRFIWTGPGSWKIWTTVRQNLSSTNERKVAFAYKKLDLKADNELAKFVKTKVAGGMKLSGEERESFAVNAAGETTEDALEGFEAIITEYGSQTDALLVGLQLIAECHTVGKEVRVTKGINSESAIGAQRIGNQDFGEGSNSTNSATKTFRRDVQEGYSSYGNFENF
tara:strand:+ start:416 stop:1069 length:654 start_codon:yes stop_codon:yes gene_type:complete